ncbi:hypothetical protein J6Z48_03470, partial [bacterium]|nr:hypothetical protein [bacterium]
VQAKKEGNGSLEFKIRNFLNRAKEHGALGKKPNFWKRLNILVFRLAGKQNHYVLVINKHVYQILVNNKGWMYQTKI